MSGATTLNTNPKSATMALKAAHKFLLHLDGTAASNRLLKLLFMGSVVLKQDSVYEEFFYKDLKPGSFRADLKGSMYHSEPDRYTSLASRS